VVENRDWVRAKEKDKDKREIRSIILVNWRYWNVEENISIKHSPLCKYYSS